MPVGGTVDGELVALDELVGRLGAVATLVLVSRSCRGKDLVQSAVQPRLRVDVLEEVLQLRVDANVVHHISIAA